ncbi:SAM-dependent methyltransferase, partial [Ruminococcaceae bacterium OttesenSCG-928-L11]|nr:SAM-dependent methyltransferase [Ruminococcaceae bacterium OttesenSCG-928-L11]
MGELEARIQIVTNSELVHATLSKPIGEFRDCKQIKLRRFGEQYQAEWMVGPQAFHENIRPDTLEAWLLERIPSRYMQLHAYTETMELALAVSKKGKVLYRESRLEKPIQADTAHNREKQYLLREGTVIPPLVDMGVFTADGRIVKAMYDKYRQINRFIELIDEVIRDKGHETLTVVDFGCGKGYLTFLLYYYLVEIRGIRASVTGIDLKRDVMEKCNGTARQYGYEGLRFVCGDIREYKSETPVDMVISLHACDTATDYALCQSVVWNARYIFSIPCCQHEANGQMSGEGLPLVTRYGVIQEKIASNLTDAIRGNLLSACGYKVQLIDAVNPVHTPKNILIRAIRSSVTPAVRARALEEVRQVTELFQLRPCLEVLLE